MSRVFNATFGEHHLTLKCVTRSILATCVFVSAVIVTVYVTTGRMRSLDRHFWSILISIGFTSDYVALWKTRFLLRRKLSAIILLTIDVGLSLAISSIFFVFVYHSIKHFTLIANILGYSNYDDLPSDIDALMIDWDSVIHMNNLYFYIPPVMFISTLLTSIWTLLIIVSSIVLQLLSPTQRFVVFFFDVERHPIKAIGIVAGALAIICSLVWSCVRLLLRSA